jgi:hypothetical protein
MMADGLYLVLYVHSIFILPLLINVLLGLLGLLVLVKGIACLGGPGGGEKALLSAAAAAGGGGPLVMGNGMERNSPSIPIH